MIPYIESMLEHERAGTMSIHDVVRYVVKTVAKSGDKSDFDLLPEYAKAEVMRTLDWYKRNGAWFYIDSSGTEENCGVYADEFIRKVFGGSFELKPGQP